MLYTAITGDKDFPRKDIKVFSEYNEFKRPVMNAKIYKILAHQYIDEDISVWLDGNLFLKIPEEQLVKEFLGDADMAIFKHPDRDCVYDEAEAAKGLGGEAKRVGRRVIGINPYPGSPWGKIGGWVKSVIPPEFKYVERFDKDRYYFEI